MRCRGAVLHGVGQDWQIEDIELDAPGAGEVLVEMKVAGICHSDDHFTTGDMVPTPDLAAVMTATGNPPLDFFPLLGGHEGAGVVAEVGPEVRSVRPGDPVAMSFMPARGNCRFCVSGTSYLCDNGAMLFDRGMVADGPAAIWATRTSRR